MKNVKTKSTEEVSLALARPVVKFNGEAVVSRPLGELTTEQAGVAHYVVHFLGDRLKAREEELRGELLERSGEEGTPDAKGHYHLPVMGGELIVEKRVASKPTRADEDKIRSALLKRGIPLEKVFDLVTVPQLNPALLEALLSSNKGLAKELQDGVEGKVTWALKWKTAPPAVRGLLEASRNG